MNPGELNKKLYFYKKSVTDKQEKLVFLFKSAGKMIIKTKRRADEQNGESYEFIIRNRNNVEDYQLIHCNDIWYDILTIEEYQKEKGYLLLRCEKAKIHNFYDSVTVTRTDWVETDWGEDKEQLIRVYDSIPCQLIKINSASVNQTDQQLDLNIKYAVEMETKYNLKIGDKLEIIHKQDNYDATVEDFFRYHTYQEITVKLEGDA